MPMAEGFAQRLFGIGIAGLRSMQGDMIEIAPVTDERILSAAKSIIFR